MKKERMDIGKFIKITDCVDERGAFLGRFLPLRFDGGSWVIFSYASIITARKHIDTLFHSNYGGWVIELEFDGKLFVYGGVMTFCPAN